MKKILNFLAVLVIALSAFTFTASANQAEKSDMENPVVIISVPSANVGTAIAAQIMAAECANCIIAADELTNTEITAYTEHKQIQLPKILNFSELINTDSLNQPDQVPKNLKNDYGNKTSVKTSAPVVKTRYVRRE